MYTKPSYKFNAQLVNPAFTLGEYELTKVKENIINEILTLNPHRHRLELLGLSYEHLSEVLKRYRHGYKK